MRDVRALTVLLLILAFCASLPAAAVENWPQWRGPGGQGVSADTDVPTEWAPDKNVLWKAELPGTGMSSPIVWGDRIYLTASSKETWSRGNGPSNTGRARKRTGSTPTAWPPTKNTPSES
jgi:hypothetical protein